MTYSPKHTPGPWIQGTRHFFLHSSVHGRGGDSHIVRDSNNNLIADVAGPSTRDLLVSKANARLIAAAPALLKILEGFLATLDEPNDDKAAVVESYYDANFELWSAAMNVFQEATGEEEGQL